MKEPSKEELEVAYDEYAYQVVEMQLDHKEALGKVIQAVEKFRSEQEQT